MKSNRTFGIALGVVIVGGLIVVAGAQYGWFDGEPMALPNRPESKKEKQSDRKVEHRSLSESLGVSEDDMVEVGGIKRPKRDLLPDTKDLVEAREKYQTSVPDPGKSPLVAPDTNPTVAKLHEEIDGKVGRMPAKSTYYGAEPFDRDEFLKNPIAYTSLTRPARVFQSAQPNSDVKQIRSKTERFQEILQGETVVLEAIAEPNMPVTFHTQQLGEFDNRLKTITIQASEEGIAKVNYKAVSGVAGLINIMAASPANSGQLKYMINVNLPDN